MEHHRQGARQAPSGRAEARRISPLSGRCPPLPGDGDATQRHRALASPRPPHASHALSLAPARANEPVTQASGSRRNSIGTLSQPRPRARSTSIPKRGVPTLLPPACFAGRYLYQPQGPRWGAPVTSCLSCGGGLWWVCGRRRSEIPRAELSVGSRWGGIQG